MSAVTSAVNRVPMGASDLKANSQRFLRNAILISCGLHLLLIGIYIGSTYIKPKDEAA